MKTEMNKHPPRFQACGHIHWNISHSAIVLNECYNSFSIFDGQNLRERAQEYFLTLITNVTVLCVFWSII